MTHRKERKKACKTALYGKTRKATGFKSLRVNCWEINEVTNIKMPTDFLNKPCKKRFKTGKVNITIEFDIFEIVQVPNFSLK